MIPGSIILRHRLLVTTLIALLAAALVATPKGTSLMAWVDGEYTSAIEKAVHVRSFSLNRLNPTCPQCM